MLHGWSKSTVTVLYTTVLVFILSSTYELAIDRGTSAHDARLYRQGHIRPRRPIVSTGAHPPTIDRGTSAHDARLYRPGHIRPHRPIVSTGAHPPTIDRGTSAHDARLYRPGHIRPRRPIVSTGAHPPTTPDCIDRGTSAHDARLYRQGHIRPRRPIVSTGAHPPTIDRATSAHDARLYRPGHIRPRRPIGTVGSKIDYNIKLCVDRWSQVRPAAARITGKLWLVSTEFRLKRWWHGSYGHLRVSLLQIRASPDQSRYFWFCEFVCSYQVY